MTPEMNQLSPEFEYLNQEGASPKEKNKSTHRSVSASDLENLDSLEDPVSVDHVVNAVLSHLGRSVDCQLVTNLRRVRKDASSGICDYRKAINEVRDSLKEWKGQHSFLARPGKTRKVAMRAGTEVSESEVREIWNSEEADLLAENIVGCYHESVNRLFSPRGNNDSRVHPLPIETDPRNYLGVGRSGVFNLTFNKNKPEKEFGLQIKLGYDYLIRRDSDIIIVDTNFEHGYSGRLNVKALLQCMLVNNMMKSTETDVISTRPIDTRNLRMSNVVYIRRFLNTELGRFVDFPISLDSYDFSSVWEDLCLKGLIFVNNYDYYHNRVVQREQSFVMPHIPDEKDIGWPSQPSLALV